MYRLSYNSQVPKSCISRFTETFKNKEFQGQTQHSHRIRIETCPLKRGLFKKENIW